MWLTESKPERHQDKIELIKFIPSWLGFSFDLSPLAKAKSYYTVDTLEYLFYISICGSLPVDLCSTKSAACQVTQRWVTNSVVCKRSLVAWCVLSVCNNEQFACKVITGLPVIDSGNLHIICSNYTASCFKPNAHTCNLTDSWLVRWNVPIALPFVIHRHCKL